MFDRFVVVDWSANSTPKQGRDSIWIAAGDASGVSVVNPPTRRRAEELLGQLVDDAVGARTLIGLDVALGYPSGTAAALGLDGDDPWRSTVEFVSAAISDDDRNANNRFQVAAEVNRRVTGGPGPFWGCPPGAVAATLAPTKPPEFAPVTEWRMVETALRSQRRRPFSVWQLLGAGAVGSQSLLALPVVHRLLRRHPGRVGVWPVTTGLTVPDGTPGSVVITEVWPSMMEPVVADTHGAREMVRDEAQVRATLMWMARLATTGALAECFEPDVSDTVRAQIEREEGWVLGVGV